MANSIEPILSAAGINRQIEQWKIVRPILSMS